ncbi:DUF475 domain-containing protein [Chitinimonas lacunae]|uniref:DUF475 domain-containing protein n=1 Tax=Chitinimonas lacunae TaxID=1963018 RepID=A0ABV8MVH4_9NEIS
MVLKYFRGSLIFTALSVVGGYMLGGLGGAWIVLVLAALETSVSFDNAVVNARILKDMDPVWRQRFLVWGMLIAVFLMRLIFPLLIVGVIAQLGPIDVLRLAIFEKAEYSRVLTSAHPQIAAFGGTFLLLVFLKFFVDQAKDHHWLGWIEAQLTKLGKLDTIEIALAILALYAASKTLDIKHQQDFLIAGMFGIITFVLADGIGGLVGSDDVAGGAAKQGLAGFLYLEVLDASFSFDGVIAAFALSNDLFVIALGLGVGAMFVRSFTLMLVDQGTLSNYRYLEHGAFWAIGALAAIMLGGVSFHIPEALTGGIGLALIGIAFWSSKRANAREASQT